MSLTDAIYLDFQATTRLANEAFDAMLPYLNAHFWNPHSAHRLGRAMKAVVENARDNVETLLPSGGQTIFTSGATEAINLAIKGSMTSQSVIAVSAIEHAAVLDTAEWLAGQGATLIVLPVTADGLVDVAEAERLLPERIDLIAVMQVNNEIGTIQPVEALADLAHARGGLLLCDAVQGYGRLPAPANADLIAVSAHKIYGPKGIGALWVRDGVKLSPLIHGGGQEQGLRSGTLSPALCAGFGAAAKVARTRMEADAAQIAALWQLSRTHFAGWTINGSVDARYHGNLNIRRDGVDVARLMSDLREVAFSAGSACASGSGRPSHVLRAIGLSDAQAKSSIRLGWGRYSTEEDIIVAARLINGAAEEIL
ncbi:MAG TPA: cysteine desulfurase family protein [Sphingorhabdus sp.]|jgi:cysteine desulfurase|uniref:cysteine desulfurase family protein n=1 Tax=Sphingorhabdus sp. TaxID=1902408 RepID=UPI002C4FFBAB|nr:cysteine desulfurase family protein [Sphingorhabdus sp.]HMT42809.1 cysteine desulfurase family protein [Sphingorhabdus sp.]HMU21737.1 cysteine desulfurase family protein [Sphingorhabdus sp.]